MTHDRTRNFLFRPPKFILLPAVGIEISDRSIKFAEFRTTGTRRHLGRFGHVALDSGIVEGGRIVDQARLIVALKKLREKEKLSFVRAALPEEQMYFFRATVPSGTPEAIRETLELSLEDHVPIPTMEAIFDFEEIKTEGGETEVTVTVANESIIQSYTDTFSEAGLSLLSLELEASAVTRAVMHREDSTTRMVLDFGETRTGIAIVQNGRVLFTSTVAVGGQMLTETLAKHFGVSFAEAETMKREYGLRRNSPKQDLFSLLLNNIAVLRDELNRHLIYWHTHPDEKGKPHLTIEEIVLVGGDSNLAGLADYLSTSLRMRATIADVWTNAHLSAGDIPDISRNDSLGYATAIGLALRGTDYE